MLRFTIRDVLWLMVVVGLCIGWHLHYQSSTVIEQTEVRPAYPSWYLEDPDYPEKYRRASKLVDELAAENERLQKELNQLRGKKESPKVIRIYPLLLNRP